MVSAAKQSKGPIGRVGRRGFTFIEILATMLLLGIVLPAIMSGISLCLSTAGFARQQAQAVTLAHGKLMDLVVEKQWQQGNLSGDFSPDWPDYRWTAQVSNWDGETLEQLDVTVWWRHRGIERSGTVSTLVNTGLSYESTDETE